MLAQGAIAVRGREVPSRPSGLGCADRRGESFGQLHRIRKIAGFGDEQFAGAEPRQEIRKFVGAAGRHREAPGREFGDRDRRKVVLEGGRGGDEILAALVQERFVHQGSGGEDAGHGAVDDALRILGILDLIADRHSESLIDESSQVALGGVVGDAGHGHALGPLGQRDPEGSVCGLGIRAEELVEVTHAKEQQAVRMGGLEPRELPHRRGLPGGPAIGLRDRGGRDAGIGRHVDKSTVPLVGDRTRRWRGEDVGSTAWRGARPARGS